MSASREPGDVDLPEEFDPIVPEGVASAFAADLLEDLADDRPKVGRVLDRARGRRDDREVAPSDHAAALRHSDGELALVSWGNTGLSVFGYVGGLAPRFVSWSYSVIAAERGRDPVTVEEITQAELEKRIAYGGPAIVLRSETPLGGGGL